MAFTFRTPTVVTGTTGTEPSGTVSGDGLIAICEGTSTPSLATGWTSAGTFTDVNSRIWLVASIQRGASAPSYVFSGAAGVSIYTLVQPTSMPSVAILGYQLGGSTASTRTVPANSFGASSSLIIVTRLASSAFASNPQITNLTSGPWNAASNNTADWRGDISAAGNGPYTLSTWTNAGSQLGGGVQVELASVATVTATVSSTAAVSQTVTRTVTSAGAASQAATRTVSSTAAATRVAARTVTSAASVTTGTIVTKTVTSTAAATATVTKAVTSTAATTTTLTKTVSSSAAASRTHTATVTTLASANRVVTASVTSNAAVSITHTRSVTTTASAGAVVTKLVTSTGAASRTLSATVGTVAAVVIQRMPVNLPGAAVVIDTRTTGAPVVIETRLPGAPVVIDTRTNGGSVTTSRGY